MIENLENEIWEDIVVDKEELNTYKGLYQVSNIGRVRNSKTGRILKQWKDRQGYFNVKLYKDSNKKTYKVHRLVALAFIPNTENKPQVDHINTIRHDNRMENLRWATQSENNNNELTLKHISELNKGKIRSKESIEKQKETIKLKNKNKIKVDKEKKDHRIICITTKKVFNSIKEAGEYYNINQGNICDCCRGKYKSAGKLNGVKLVWMYYKDYIKKYEIAS